MNMFKFFASCLAVLGLAISLQAQTTVNFSVDMSLTPWVHPNGIFLAGSFNGWTDEAMTDPDGDGIYTLSRMLTPGHHEFKFKNGPNGWEYFGGNHPNLTYDCITGPDNNRFIEVGNVEINVHYCFNLCIDCSELTEFVGNYEPIVAVNSPQSIFGLYDFSAALSGPNLATGIWTADVAFVNDGTADPTLGCQSLINAAELNGKIALIDRGICAFYYKLLNAQTAGAIGVVMLNGVPGEGSFEINAGVGNPIVTIPVVMLSYEDGEIIRQALANGPVNMTIGNYQFQNDLGINKHSVINAPLGVVPASQATADNFSFLPGAVVRNNGVNDATNIKIAANIEHVDKGGATTVVYDESTTISLIEADTSGFATLPPYLPNVGKGVYYVNYEITSDSIDDVVSNNLLSSKFLLSENTYCKGGWDDDNNRPLANNAYTDFGGGSIEFLAGFGLPNGENVVLESIQFYVTTGTGPSLGTIGLENINGFVYEWTDTNGDGRFDNTELEMVGKAPVVNVDTSLNEAWVTAPIHELTNFEEGYPVPGNNKKYVVGVRYQGPEYVFFGFDEGYDQRAFVENGNVTDLDLPYFIVKNWNGDMPDVEEGFLFPDLYVTVATALNISGGDVKAEEPSALATATVSLFPNPATDFVMVKLNGETPPQQVTVQIFNSLGVMIRQFEVNASDFSAGFRVEIADLEAGFYTMRIGSEGQFASGKFLKLE